MRELLAAAVKELAKAGCETPRLDAEVLLAHALGCERFKIFTTGCQAPCGKIQVFKSYIERRKKWEPVAYITGIKEFWSLPIKVTPDVLIPRPETEDLVEKSLKLLKQSPWYIAQHTKILDLCTGSGCIAAALAKELPAVEFVVSDVSKKALDIAKENLAFAANRVQFVQSNLFENISEKFDWIVSNPPYCKTTDLENLMPEVRFFEPRLALDGGLEGLDFIVKIRQDAPQFLNPNGWLILENGPDIEIWKVSSLKAASLSKDRFKSAGPKTLPCP